MERFETATTYVIVAGIVLICFARLIANLLTYL